MSSNFLCIALALLVVAGPAVRAQSLGEVARQEEARRKTVKQSGKVYTNESLRAEAAAPAPPPSSAAQARPADQAASAPSPDPADAKKDEAYWKKRLQDARDALDRSKSFAEALQSRINALTTDFTARADPAQRAQIGNDRQKALAELDRVKKEIEANTKAIADIQEEARKAGVPAGWVR
jgi:hypothetical protein